MKIDIISDNMDIKPGSIFRALLESWLGPNWQDYTVVYLEKTGLDSISVFKSYMIHNEDGPAAVKQDGTMEWWLNGQKLFVKTQQEFECYMRNKAFW